MDSSDRDRSIETLLRQRQREADPQSMEQCVDAEVLAAWMDDGLSGDGLAAVEKHAAGCARCQALLASMARTKPVVVDRPWWRALTAKWLVPIAAVATALVVWVSVSNNSRESKSPPAATQSARAVQLTPETVSSVPLSLPDLSVADKKSGQTASTPQSARKDDQQGAAGGSSLDKSVNQQKTAARLEPRRGVVGGVAGGVAAGAVDAVRPLQDRAESAAAAATPPPPAAPIAAPGPPQPVAAGESKVRTPESAAAKPVAETVTVTPSSAANAAAGRGAAFRTGLTEIASPEADFRWRLVPPSTIERSTDGGTTWAAQPLQNSDALRLRSQRQTAMAAPVAGGMMFTAGTAPSRNVCWVVGRAGVVVLSIDGTTWQTRPFPEATDLIAVRASDAKAATVTTADGRHFSTTDGGATWVLVK